MHEIVLPSTTQLSCKIIAHFIPQGSHKSLESAVWKWHLLSCWIHPSWILVSIWTLEFTDPKLIYWESYLRMNGNETKSPFLIGLAGGTASGKIWIKTTIAIEILFLSGKSTVANTLMRALGQSSNENGHREVTQKIRSESKWLTPKIGYQFVAGLFLQRAQSPGE